MRLPKIDFKKDGDAMLIGAGILFILATLPWTAPVVDKAITAVHDKIVGIIGGSN